MTLNGCLGSHGVVIVPDLLAVEWVSITVLHRNSCTDFS